MKNASKLLNLWTLIVLFGCQVGEPLEQIIDIDQLKDKTTTEVSEILGAIESRKSYTDHPCESANCEMITFEDGKYEILFKEGKTNRITIYKTPDLTANNKAVTALGLDAGNPSFKNEGMVIRWENYMGYSEISFFSDYINIIID